MTPAEYQKLKGLKRENLRDHMDDFELIFTMLGERSTTEIHRTEDSKGFAKLKSDARAGGDIAAVAKNQGRRPHRDGRGDAPEHQPPLGP